MLRRLGISTIVHGRHNNGTRVTYLLDPEGAGDARAIPEEIILRRWKGKEHAAYTHHGTRLNPNVWRAVQQMLGRDTSLWLQRTVEMLHELRSEQPKKSEIPQAKDLHAMIHALGGDILGAILRHHINEEGESAHGVPDLFLCTRRRSDGTIAKYQFVEVKKPKEPLSHVQKEAIAMLHSLGIPAREIRLIER
jgi:hypothetical protein